MLFVSLTIRHLGKEHLAIVGVSSIYPTGTRYWSRIAAQMMVKVLI